MSSQRIESAFSNHLLEYRSVEKSRLILSLSITLAVMILELVGGVLTNSLALISDGWHMFTHSFAIGISLGAIIIAKNPPCHHRTFGLYRAEVLAAFVNALFLLLVAAFLVYEAILKIVHPVEILAAEMLLIALVGLTVNVISIFLLQSGKKTSLNIRALLFHILGDTISSVGIVIAAIIIFFTGWTLIDPLISLFISTLIIIWALALLADSARILLEMTPKGLTTETVKSDLQHNFPEIEKLYNVHLWTITSEMLVFSAHVKLKPINNPLINGLNITSRMNGYLSKRYGIIESTIQISFDDKVELCD